MMRYRKQYVYRVQQTHTSERKIEIVPLCTSFSSFNYFLLAAAFFGALAFFGDLVALLRAFFSGFAALVDVFTLEFAGAAGALFAELLSPDALGLALPLDAALAAFFFGVAAFLTAAFGFAAAFALAGAFAFGLAAAARRRNKHSVKY